MELFMRTYQKPLTLLRLLPLLALVIAACSSAPAAATPDIQATVNTAVAEALEALPTQRPTPDIQATVDAAIAEALAALQTTAPAPTMARDDSPNPYAAAAASVVKIETSLASGSGVILGDAYHVVTNQHVIDNASDADLVVSYALEGKPSQRTQASVVWESADWDLALLRLDDSLGPPIKVARKLPSIGDALVIGGFPGIGGDTLTVTTGTVAGFEFDDQYIKVDAAIFPGNSGGAALDSNGRLVGIPTSVATDEGGALGFLISARLLRGDFTEALLNDLNSPRPTGDTPYVLDVLGVPAVITVPEGWEIFSTMGYLHAEQPGSDPYALDSNYQIFGIFSIDLLPSETGNDALNRLLEESSGEFELVNRNDIDLPLGFTDTILVRATERVHLSNFQTRTSVLGSWIADSGLITRFVAGEANGQAVIAFIESSALAASRDADELLSRIRLSSN
jgi:S1-C subfamily serine protease